MNKITHYLCADIYDYGWGPANTEIIGRYYTYESALEDLNKVIDATDYVTDLPYGPYRKHNYTSDTYIRSTTKIIGVKQRKNDQTREV